MVVLPHPMSIISALDKNLVGIDIHFFATSQKQYPTFIILHVIRVTENIEPPLYYLFLKKHFGLMYEKYFLKL